MVLDNMAGHISFACFETLVCIILEAKTGSVIGSCLLSISNPKCYMVYVRIESVPKPKILPYDGFYPLPYIYVLLIIKIIQLAKTPHIKYHILF